MFLNAHLRWLKEAKHFWLTVFIAGAALAIALRPGSDEVTIRWTGLVLQLLGVGTVALGIAETRALFGKPTLLRWFESWVKRWPLIKRPPTSASAHMTLDDMTMRARARATFVAPPGADFETRIDALERNIEGVNTRIDQTQAEIDAEVNKLQSALKQEVTAREAEDALTRQKLEASETGGIHISAMGTLWLFLGVILSTASPEIAGWMGLR